MTMVGRATASLTRLVMSGVLMAGGLITGQPFGAAHAEARKIGPGPWMLVYTDKVPVRTLLKYDTIVLDSRYHPPLRPLIEAGKTVIGYISIGEVEKFRPHYKAVEKEGILLHWNKNWPDSRFVDVRDPRWTKRVIEELIPQILQKGFRGIMMDTLDNPADLERRDPKKYRGMTDAAARLVRTIRRHYPDLIIMMNRAYEILPSVERHIDIVLGESVYADYDFVKKTYKLVKREDYLRQVKWLQAAKKRTPRLRIFTLDYWNPDDRKGIEKIYKVQRANGFEPYVSTIKLNRVFQRPEEWR